MTLYVAGSVQVSGVPSARTVNLHNRATGALVMSTVSAGDGTFTFLNNNLTDTYYVVGLPEVADAVNAVIFDKVVYAGTLDVSAVTWNPDDKAFVIALTDGNLSHTSSGAWGTVRGTLGKSSGKFYMEMTHPNPSYIGLGVCAASHSLASKGGAEATGWFLVQDSSPDNAYYYSNAVTSDSGVSFGSGTVYGMAIDITAGKIWWSRNGVWLGSGDPENGTNPKYTGLTGTLYPAGTASISGATAIFSETNFTYQPPNGFTIWQ